LKNISRLSKIAALFVLCIAACSKVEQDSIAPAFASLTVNSESFLPGQELSIQVSGTDNLELNQVRLLIEPAFSKSFGFWKILEIRDISGSSFNTDFRYTVPDSALAGLYELSIQIADERGNGSVDSTLQFFVRQPGEEPVISGFATNPGIDPDDVLRVSATDT
jgi:hypothetical protein